MSVMQTTLFNYSIDILADEGVLVSVAAEKYIKFSFTPCRGFTRLIRLIIHRIKRERLKQNSARSSSISLTFLREIEHKREVEREADREKEKETDRYSIHSIFIPSIRFLSDFVEKQYFPLYKHYSNIFRNYPFCTGVMVSFNQNLEKVLILKFKP